MWQYKPKTHFKNKSVLHENRTSFHHNFLSPSLVQLIQRQSASKSIVMGTIKDKFWQKKSIDFLNGNNGRTSKGWYKHVYGRFYTFQGEIKNCRSIRPHRTWWVNRCLLPVVNKLQILLMELQMPHLPAIVYHCKLETDGHTYSFANTFATIKRIFVIFW